MFCYNCGKELNDDFNLCPYCGADITRYSDETADKAKEYITIFYKGIMPSEKILDLPVDCNTLTGCVNL